jgi:hypothetical protein
MMDEKMSALVDPAAPAAVSGRRLRPAAKFAMKGVVAASDATAVAGRGISRLYNEVVTDHSLRPAAKVVMRGVVAASRATTRAGRGIEQLYKETKA